ncbi:MAG: ATP-dependent helicase [Roseburia sp.]|nr:ATP-dependent helicase [Roseburia sp.]
MLKLRELNDAQRKAVAYGAEDPLLVLAGPGSGKTFTLTKRILFLIEQAHISPEKILVLTFAKSAALDMQRRFQEQPELKNQTYPVNFGTFHSVFYSILCQSHVLKPECFLSESGKRNLLLPLIKDYFAEKKEGYIGSPYKEAADLLSAFSFYKNTWDREKTLQRLSPVWKDAFDGIFHMYEQKRISCGGFDFDDILLECLKLFRQNQNGLHSWQERFPYLLLDEFQDINPVQYQAIRLLGEAGRIFAVGDDDQSIYGFRGSSPACMRQFAKDFRAKQILLDVNYRSNPDIVKASLLVIGENQERFPKNLRAYKSSETEEDTVKVRYFPQRQEQTAYLLEQLGKIPGAQTGAVLFRTNIQMQRVAASLKRAGIPYTVREKSQNIYEHFVVRDMMAYLTLADKAGKSKSDDLLQIINKPMRYVSREVMAMGQPDLPKLLAYYEQSPESAGKEAAIKELVKLQQQLKRMEGMSPFLAIQYIRKVVGYENYLYRLAGKNEREWTEWRELLEWLSGEAVFFENVQDWTVFQRQKDRVKAAPVREPENHSVQLMTVHASKGLEFDRVWIPDCNERIFPYGQMHDSETLEEERRIFYVAMTRAKKSLELLCLTGTADSPRQPSRFLTPIPRLFHQIHSCQDTRQRHPTPFHTPRRPR